MRDALTSPSASDATAPPRTRRTLQRGADGRARVVLALVVVLVAAACAVTADALSRAGEDTAVAKLAEWARDHDLDPVVTWLEQVQYAADQPTTGGVPAGGIPTAPGIETPSPPTGPGRSANPRLGPAALLDPTPLAPLAGGSSLPGEGRWQTVVVSRGLPAVQVTSLRPDGLHTSYLVGVLRMDPRLVRGQLRPGTQDPGGSWPEPTALAGTELGRVAVAFNGGFRLTDPSRNGYYSDHRTVAPLVDGKASLVLRTNGTADVGSWNQEVHIDSAVASVRQNLQMLVDHGQVNPTCATGGTHEWGSTIGQAAYISRSGFGVTATGVEVYVGGPALSVCTLGRILADAGVQRGLELDINPHWVSGTYFHPRPGGPPQGFSLFPAEQVAPTHYLIPTPRDWFAWFLR